MTALLMDDADAHELFAARSESHAFVARDGTLHAESRDREMLSRTMRMRGVPNHTSWSREREEGRGYRHRGVGEWS